MLKYGCKNPKNTASLPTTGPKEAIRKWNCHDAVPLLTGYEICRLWNACNYNKVYCIPDCKNLSQKCLYKGSFCWCSGEIKQQQLCVPRMHSMPDQSYSHPLHAITPTHTVMQAQAGGKMDHVQACAAEVTGVSSSNFQPQSVSLVLSVVVLALIKHSILFSVVWMNSCVLIFSKMFSPPLPPTSLSLIVP